MRWNKWHVNLSDRYCLEEWRDLRTAIASRKANMLAFETASMNKVPIVWTKSTGEAWSNVPGCFLLEYEDVDLPDAVVDFESMTSDEIDELVDNKAYV